MIIFHGNLFYVSPEFEMLEKLLIYTTVIVSSWLIQTQAAFRALDFDDSDYYLSVGP